MRIRARFAKRGKVRFTSHRDLARIWERVLRRAALPVARSEGFSPRPKLHFGLALSTARALRCRLESRSRSMFPSHSASLVRIGAAAVFVTSVSLMAAGRALDPAFAPGASKH